MSTQNLYQILDLPNYSDIELIKKSFRQLALKYHPDRNPDPAVAETFKNIVKAYEVLNNPEQKQNYDLKLKSGFIYEFVEASNTAQSERDNKRTWYAKMRKDYDEMIEVENITSYENSLTVMPFIWRLLIIGLLQITGILSIVGDWYRRGNMIAFGIFLFVFASLFLWNELYKHFWYKSKTRDEKNYERQAYSRFILLFILGFFLTVGLIKIKKAWQLNNFGTVIYAGMNGVNRTISYTYKDQFYLMEAYKIPDELYFKEQVLIRISTKEPEIWEFVED